MEECHLLLTDQINLMNPEGNRAVHDISKPLPLGGPPGQLKAAYNPDFGLEELVPSLWIKSERDYDISAAYGKLNQLSGANKVHLFNAVNLWIRNIAIRQCVEDLQLGIESYQTKLNLTQPRWNATDFLFKEDYTIVHKPRAVIYKDRNNQKKMMRETNEDGNPARANIKQDLVLRMEKENMKALLRVITDYKGGNVVFSEDVINDGVTIAKVIELSDSIENAGGNAYPKGPSRLMADTVAGNSLASAFFI
ncbi:hypothetical protein Tco_1229897 [Tanacetum coccineum]